MQAPVALLEVKLATVVVMSMIRCFSRIVRHRSMRRLAHPARNARRAIVSMDSVATANATTNAWRVARRKKAAASMEFVGRSNTTPIPITIVRTARAMGKTNAKTTMVFLVYPGRNVCRTIAWTAFAATTFAWAVAKHAAQRKKAAVKMVFVARSKQLPIPITNARTAIVMARAPARRARNPHFPMARHARQRRNAHRAIARTACVVTAGV
jgi:hypothetical protein